MPEAVIVSTARSPIGRAGKGSLVSIRPDDLAAQIVRAALDKVPAARPARPRRPDDGLRPARRRVRLQHRAHRRGAARLRLPARHDGQPLLLVVAADHPDGVPRDQGRRGHAFVSAGVETVSRFANGSADGWPNTRNELFAEAEQRTAKVAESGAAEWHDPREDGLLPDVYIAMGQTAENLALLKDVSREDMDHFGVRSQNLAEQAIEPTASGRATSRRSRCPTAPWCRKDDGPRAGVTYEAVSGLKPVFRPDGRVTAGNCCPLNDGAAAVVVMSDDEGGRARPHPAGPHRRHRGQRAVAGDHGPTARSRRPAGRWRTAGMSIGDIDLVEINEAFAAQVIPSYRDLGIDLDRLNVNGGAIAVGHPFGMTGARITTTLINSLQYHDKQFGLETMCVGGGQGMAMILERLS